jgi:sugar-specific transcriptional regulator TrmB
MNGLMKLTNLLEINIIILYMSIDYSPNNTFIFSFVRMNPPTPGHLVVIKTLIDKAIELGSEKAYIITSSSLDGKNPLPCSRETLPKPKTKADGVIIDQLLTTDLVYKSSILEEMIASYKRQLIDAEPLEEEAKSLEPVKDETGHEKEVSKTDCDGDSCAMVGGNRRRQIENLDVIVLCSTGSPFGFIYSIIKRDFIDRGVPKINMFFIVGRDRADFLDTIVDNFKTKDYVKSIDGEILGREGMTELKTSGLGDRSIEDIDPSAYSASFIRGLVKNGQREEFNQVYSRYLPPENIQKMFETIQIGIQMKSPASKDEDENPQSRYFDGKLLPIIVKLGGRRKQKTSKAGRAYGTNKTRRKSRKTKSIKKRKTYRKRRN